MKTTTTIAYLNGSHKLIVKDENGKIIGIVPLRDKTPNNRAGTLGIFIESSFDEKSILRR